MHKPWGPLRDAPKATEKMADEQAVIPKAAMPWVPRLARTGFALGAAAALSVSMSTQAHTVWLEPQQQSGQYLVMFGGHEGKTETYPAHKLGQVRAWGRDGDQLAVQRRVDGPDDGVRINAPGAVLLTASFDNGYWSKGSDGKSRNVPMNELPGAVSGVQAIKFHKFIADWSPIVARPVGQAFELVPVQSSTPRAGQPLALRVLLDGKPVAGIALAFGEEGRDAVTTADGVATLSPRPGRNRIWAGRRVAVQGDPRTTQHSIEYSLVFDAH